VLWRRLGRPAIMGARQLEPTLERRKNSRPGTMQRWLFVVPYVTKVDAMRTIVTLNAHIPAAAMAALALHLRQRILGPCRLPRVLPRKGCVLESALARIRKVHLVAADITPESEEDVRRVQTCACIILLHRQHVGLERPQSKSAGAQR